MVHLPSGDMLPMAYWYIDTAANESSWQDLPSSFTTNPDDPLVLWLAVTRRDFNQDEFDELLGNIEQLLQQDPDQTHAYSKYKYGYSRFGNYSHYSYGHGPKSADSATDIPKVG